MMDKLWLVGQWKGQAPGEHVAWEFQGVFKTEDKAVEACRTFTYFVVPVKVGETKKHETKEWQGLYYPIEMFDTDET